DVASSAAERQEARARLAQVLGDRLGRKEESAQLYLSLLADGADASASAALERLASQGIRQAEIAAALAAHYQKRGDHQRHAAALLMRLPAVTDEERKQLLRQLGAIHETHLADSRAAFDFALRALTLDPADRSLLDDAVRLSRDLSSQ